MVNAVVVIPPKKKDIHKELGMILKEWIKKNVKIHPYPINTEENGINRAGSLDVDNECYNTAHN